MLSKNERKLEEIYKQQASQGVNGWLEMQVRKIFRGAAALAVVGGIVVAVSQNSKDDNSNNNLPTDSPSTSEKTTSYYVERDFTGFTKALDSSESFYELKDALLYVFNENQKRNKFIALPIREDGSKWEGDVSITLLQGAIPNTFGKYTWKNGDVYIGHWDTQHGIHGKGYLKLADGTEFVGEFIDGKLHGKAIMKKHNYYMRAYTYDHGTQIRSSIIDCERPGDDHLIDPRMLLLDESDILRLEKNGMSP